ncbi:MAG: PepSY-associated TM helix domain-containing protein [Kofleriaceae bacterium]
MVDLKKRWRAYLRAVHRDFGYLAIGFTVIYAVSGIAQNHIEDWGDVSYNATERTVAIPEISPTTPEIVAVKQVADAVGLGAPTKHSRAGDEVRLEYDNGTKVVAIGTTATVQQRSRRAFIGIANWLHTARGKKAWKYISDVYAVFLLYLAISGIFMIKGRLGLKWRGTILIGAGFAVPILYVALAGGPESQKTKPVEETAMKVVPVGIDKPTIQKPPPVEEEAKPTPQPDELAPNANPAGSAILTPLPPDD